MACLVLYHDLWILAWRRLIGDLQWDDIDMLFGRLRYGEQVRICGLFAHLIATHSISFRIFLVFDLALLRLFFDRHWIVV